jgi:hypothetical protein
MQIWMIVWRIPLHTRILFIAICVTRYAFIKLISFRNLVSVIDG